MESGGVNRILCIEDDPDIQAVLRLSLESVGGFEVRVIGSGFEAVAAAMEFTPDLILLDVMMPAWTAPRHSRNCARRRPCAGCRSYL